MIRRRRVYCRAGFPAAERPFGRPAYYARRVAAVLSRLLYQALVVKTLLTVQPHLAHTYHGVLGDENPGFSCFEVLGFDVLLDHRARPWLLEVKRPRVHSPSSAAGVTR